MKSILLNFILVLASDTFKSLDEYLFLPLLKARDIHIKNDINKILFLKKSF